MIWFTRMFFLYFAIVSIKTALFVSIQDLSTNDIIVDIKKGYALRRLGTYSPNVAEQIIHTFVSLDTFCDTSPNTDICLYASQSKGTNVLEIATIMTSRQSGHMLSYDSDSVSKSIRKDMSRVLVQHHPDKIIKDTKSITHFINNQFYYKNGDEKALITTPTTNVVDNDSDIPRIHPTSAEKIIKQININKIAFEYLSRRDLKLFLTAAFSNIDSSYTITNVKQSLDTFSKFIVAQSVFVIRHCSFNQQDLLSSKPCIAISTLFLSTPVDSAARFLIYRLIPLPTVLNNNKYMYSNLPKIIGLNLIEKNLLLWTDEYEINQCTFSPVVQCQKMPISVPLFESTCLHQLLNDNELSVSLCEVSRSQIIGQEVTDIGNGIWLFNNIHHTQYCQIYSITTGISETFSITEPVIKYISCEKKLLCADLEIFSRSCSQRRAIITPNTILNFQNSTNFTLPIKNTSTTLMSSYQSQLQQQANSILTIIKSNQSQFEQFVHEFLIYILSIVCFVILGGAAYIIKFIKYQLQRPLKNLEDLVFNRITT